MKRRNFFKVVGAGSAIAMLPKLSYGATANVVVVGGGLAGAAVAKYLRTWRGSDNVTVTLVTPASSYVTCLQSNLVVTGALPVSTITRNYDTLHSRYGVTIQPGSATSIDPINRRVRVGGSDIFYDYLVLAPGVKYIPYAGDPNATLSFWKGEDASTLKTQIDNLHAGDTFVIYIPSGTIKGAQAPYGRACAVADRRPDCTVKVLDGHGSLPPLFVDPFASFNNIVYTPNVTLNSVNLVAKTLATNIGLISYNAANVIPVQSANLDFASALLAGGPFAPVNAQTFESTVLGYDRVYIIGDAQGTTLPKSGHIAADQAKNCASAITRRIAGLQPETSLALSAVQFNAIRSTSAHKAVFSHSGFQWDGTAHPPPAPANNRWVASGAFLAANSTADSDAGVSASGVITASSENYKQGLTWVATLLDDCFK